MNIIAVDDERVALLVLKQAIKKSVPDATLSCFQSPAKALAYAEVTPVDIAFLDIEMSDMTGITLASRLKQLNSRINIIFVSAYPDYMAIAFTLRVSGYVVKPISLSSITRELENLRYPISQVPTIRIRMQCFGKFEVFLNEKPLTFSRSRAKQLLAYLVDRKGTGVSSAEISSVLWEDKEYTRSMQKQVQTVISQMMRTLKSAGIEDIIIKSWNSIAVDTRKFSCDYYDFLAGKPVAFNSYTGEYMGDYSWAEITAGLLTTTKFK